MGQSWTHYWTAVYTCRGVGIINSTMLGDPHHPLLNSSKYTTHTWNIMLRQVTWSFLKTQHLYVIVECRRGIVLGDRWDGLWDPLPPLWDNPGHTTEQLKRHNTHMKHYICWNKELQVTFRSFWLFYTIVYPCTNTRVNRMGPTTKSHYWERSSSLTIAFLFINVGSAENICKFCSNLSLTQMYCYYDIHPDNVTYEFITFGTATRHTSIKNWSRIALYIEGERTVQKFWN